MTRVTYIVTPKNKKEQPFEVKTLKEAVTATSNRTTGDYKVKYTRVEEDLQAETLGNQGPARKKNVVDKCFLMCYNKGTKKE